MSAVITVVVSIVGSAGLYTFLQFLITRKDKKDEKLDKISTRLGDVDNNLKELAKKEERNYEELSGRILENQAITARVRILRASDEILHKMRHSKEWFDQLNDDISFYEKYCADHPDFVNNKAMHAITNINEVYAKALKDNDFL